MIRRPVLCSGDRSPACPSMLSLGGEIRHYPSFQENSPSRWRFCPLSPLTFRFRVRPSGGASTYSRSVLGASRNLRTPGRRIKALLHLLPHFATFLERQHDAAPDRRTRRSWLRCAGAWRTACPTDSLSPTDCELAVPQPSALSERQGLVHRYGCTTQRRCGRETNAGWHGSTDGVPFIA